ncbi:hypothetical protein AHF37_09748 [Paragonimus kellicotti]|nr:hypothetical protein AHF37_09748 [Paragonimus kellicotti]
MSMQEFSDNLSTLSYVSRRRAPTWLFDPKKKTLLGRTATSWALCLLFYLVYYTCLVAFFMGMMMVFLHTQVPTEEPARTGMQSILQLKPGLGFRPMVDVRKSLIKFAKSDPQQYLLYTENINAYLEIYDNVNSKPSGQFANCDNGTKIPDDVEKVPTEEPARTGMQSILQLKPGLGFRPMVDVRKSLIKFAKSDPQQYLLYTENINAYLEIYDNVNSKPSGQFANCDNGTKIPDDVEKVCRFPLSKLDPCNRENKFGYPDGKPCVIVKLNKVGPVLSSFSSPFFKHLL